MKIPRSWVGRVVEIAWEDPISETSRVILSKIRKGRAALATWREFGYILDVADGVVVIAHSLGTEPGGTDPDEGFVTHIVEDLITEVKWLVPQVPAGPVATGGTNTQNGGVQ